MNKKNTALYFKVYESIREGIESGTYAEGDKLPSERKLCKDFEVSRITVREALELLEKEQFIKREHGKGSFVLGNQYTQFLNELYSFKDEIEKNGDKASTKMLSIQVISTSPFLQEKMGLKDGDRVYELKRLRLSNDTPLIYEVSYLPVYLCDGLDRFDFNSVSLYETLNQHYNIQITNAYENLVARKLSKKHAVLLNGKEDDSSMYIERFSYVDNAIIEYTQSITGSNKYKYTVKLM
ncbi:GntR family transcriptional regulator [Staphylococcus agnetis]|uniref:GntR family transcriptional regulator n=1 Tax=Staphylococcus agnetis TaxID=985762 RepID=UPI000CD2D995|nr:GntR family transcriptional regulator [Staphylococcus agnetis]MBY7664663.1 GntR family transcriptional regulator [Staphylococcus agnetis]NJH67668.1 UTRA domain-containing protein [Staphylococcus agnetis]NJH78591.1 UTRA domain-containing protein [Staphylococcus agnetis]PNY85984.1 GntR family transcriptional regulator [Staphylococcus agnetis]PTH66848.1 GntR family transcriptional regulator [Staphylococcus agnetis]